MRNEPKIVSPAGTRNHAHDAGPDGQTSEFKNQKRQVCNLKPAAVDNAALVSRRRVALSQMNAARNRQEAIATVKEILINFIGTEQFACLQFNERQRRPECLFSMGVDEHQLATLSAETAEIATALTGSAMFHDHESRAENPSGIIAAVPLKLGKELMGVIVVFDLLPQKNGWEHIDHAMFELLSDHAAASIARKRETTA